MNRKGFLKTLAGAGAAAIVAPKVIQAIATPDESKIITFPAEEPPQCPEDGWCTELFNDDEVVAIDVQHLINHGNMSLEEAIRTWRTTGSLPIPYTIITKTQIS